MFVALIPDAARKLRQRRRKAMNGIIRQLRVGHVSLHAMHGQPRAQGAAAANFDGVAEGGLARGLTDDAPVDARTARGKHFDYPLGAVRRRALFIARDEQGERAAMRTVRVQKFLGGGGHGGKPALHIGSAAPVKHSVAHRRREGVRTPILEGTCGHDIGVPGEAQERFCALAVRVAQKLSTLPNRRRST